MSMSDADIMLPPRYQSEKSQCMWNQQSPYGDVSLRKAGQSAPLRPNDTQRVSYSPLALQVQHVRHRINLQCISYDIMRSCYN